MSFYVYQLVDPRSGLPFYVGKGSGQRAWAHQKQVERGVVGGTTRKVARIREILMAGHNVDVEIVADYDSEADALDHEYRLVDSMPTLTNCVEGGCGGRTLTPEQAARRKAARSLRISRLRARERGIACKILGFREERRAALAPNARLHSRSIEEWAGRLAQLYEHRLANKDLPAAQREAAEQREKRKAWRRAKTKRVRRNRLLRKNDAKMRAMSESAS